MKLSEQKVFITGGTRGIGFALAKNLARRGAKIAVPDVPLTRGHQSPGIETMQIARYAVLTVALLAGNGPAELRPVESARHANASVATPESQDRRFVDAAFDTAFVLGSINDRVLVDPVRIAAVGASTYAFDNGGRALKAFDATGRLVWSFGRRGAGPSEFRRVRDISVGIDGSILIADQTNARLTVVDQSGALVSETPLQPLDGSPEQVIQVAPDRFVFWALALKRPIVLLSTDGTILERADPPFRIAPDIPFLGSQAQLANDPARPDKWVYGFIFANGWSVLTDLRRVLPEQGYIESVPLPEVHFEDGDRGTFSARMGAVVPSARSIAVLGDTAFVLFVGRTEQFSRLVDMYRLSDGSYEGSFLLPVIASDLAVTRERLVVLSREMVPQVISYRYRLRPGSGAQVPGH